MNILVINCGSSSIKAGVIDHETGAELARMLIERIGEAEPTVRFDGKERQACKGADHEHAGGGFDGGHDQGHGDRELQHREQQVPAAHLECHGGEEGSHGGVPDGVDHHDCGKGEDHRPEIRIEQQCCRRQKKCFGHE